MKLVTLFQKKNKQKTGDSFYAIFKLTRKGCPLRYFHCLLVSSAVDKNIQSTDGYNEIITISDGLIKCVYDLQRNSVTLIFGHLIYLYAKQRY